MDSIVLTSIGRALRLQADNQTANSAWAECFSGSETCPQSEDGGSLWWVGVIVSIIGSILSNFGVNTQKYSMIKEIRAQRSRPYIKQPIWMLGLLMVFLGAVADFGALGFAAQSLITPVGGFTMVANLFFASFWLGETITRLDMASTMLIILGIVLVAAFADKSSQCFTLENLKCLYRRKQFIAYAVVIGSAIIGLYFLITYVRKRVKKMQEKGETERKLYGRFRTVFPLMCASLSGLIGAQSVLFAKSSIEILKSAFRGNPEFAKFETYLIIIAMLIAIFGQIHWLAVGLKEFDAVIMVPVFQCVFVVFTIIGGAAYFAEFRSFNKIQTIMFPVGVLILVFGVLGLALHVSRSAEEILESAEEFDLAVVTDDSDLEAGKSTVHTPSDRETGKASDEPLSPLGSVSSHQTAAQLSEERRRSVNRFDEFNRLLPYGAVTGRFTPALMLWNEVEGAIFHRNQSHPTLFGSPSSPSLRELQMRRSSVPSRRASSRRSLRLSTGAKSRGSQSSKSGREKAASFAGVEHLLTSQRNLPVMDSSDEEEEEDEDQDNGFSESDYYSSDEDKKQSKPARAQD